MSISREKQLTIALLKEKLQKLSGKTVVFEPTLKEAKVKKLIEAIEKITGRKVVLEDAPIAGATPTVAATATPAANTQAVPGQQAAQVSDPGKIAAAKAVQAMAVDPILSKAVAQIAQQPQVKQLAQESTMNEEVISLAAILIGMAAIGALAGLSTLYDTVKANAAQKAQILAAISKDFAKAGVQATPDQIEAELIKRTGAAKAAAANKTYSGTASYHK